MGKVDITTKVRGDLRQSFHDLLLKFYPPEYSNQRINTDKCFGPDLCFRKETGENLCPRFLYFLRFFMLPDTAHRALTLPKPKIRRRSDTQSLDEAVGD
jgi:hypothetical protein